jgi:CRP/FNR family transcriptional regulator, anaerobic regulatory protein
LERVPKLEAQWDLVQQGFTPQRLARKDFFTRADQVCRSIAFVNSGCLHYYYARPDANWTGHIFFENSFLSEYFSFLTQTPGQQDIQALEDSFLMEGDPLS